MKEHELRLYADFAVKTAVNLQKGQTLVINCPVEGAFFAQMCAVAAYEAGAREVVAHYADEKMGRIRMERTELAVLEDIKPWRLRSYLDYAEADGGVAVLNISARDPEIYKGLDVTKLNRANEAASRAMRPWWEMTMSNKVQWSVVAIPSDAWAARVFPGEAAPAAVQKLWDAIFQVCRVDTGDPVGAWKQHVAEMKKQRDWLQSLDLVSLRLQSELGTDLVIGLADDNLWAGAEENSTGGVPFLANIPTEEVFTAPHRARAEGVAKSSLPYVYNGNLIEGITVYFKEGRAVEATAEKGNDLLQQMLRVDEGATHLGEIALVPASSPVKQTGLLFYNTLFDENAACHMAFGAGYPTTISGGGEMSRPQLAEMGLNDSLIHEDIMIGTPGMAVTGTTKSGAEVRIFQAGNWAR